jgi:hypothetical protein
MALLESVVITLIIVAAVLYVISLIPVPAELNWLVQIIRILVVLVFVIYLLNILFGLSGGPGLFPYTYHR